MRPKGILIDLDDTILAFEAVAAPTWRRVCERYARESGLFDADSLFGALKEVRGWFWSDPVRHRRGRLDLDAARREIVRMAFERIGVDVPSLADRVAEEYSVRREEAIDFFPGAEKALGELAGSDVALALVTNGEAEKQRCKVERFRLERFFDAILIEGELGYGKPEERVYVQALRQLDVEPGEAWSVGDHLEWDVAGPQRLGVYGVWNDYRRTGLPKGCAVVPDRIVHSIAELIES